MHESFKALVENLCAPPGQRDGGGGVFPCAPLDDAAMLPALLGEAALLADEFAGGGVLAVMDRETAALRAFPPGAGRRIIVLDGTDENAAPRLSMTPDDRLFMLLSGPFCAAFFTAAGASPAGGWTTHRPAVLEIAGALLPPECLTAPPQGPQDAGGRAAMRLAAAQARLLASREKTLLAEKDDVRAVVEIIKSISTKRRVQEVLSELVRQVSLFIDTRRCSIVRVWEDNGTGRVIVSHEDSTVSDREISLDKYPELRAAAAQAGKSLIINQAAGHPLTRDFAEVFARAGIESLLVVPVTPRGVQAGTLLLRAARKSGGFTRREADFFEILAEAAANALERAFLIDNLQRANEQLEHLAITDALTGLHNRRYLFDRIEQEMERALRYGQPLSCLMLDVDDFKRVNDTQGHIMGDAVLREIARRMRRSIRRVDIPVRYGGEEFVVLLPQTGVRGAATEAERIRATIDGTPFDGIPSGHKITVSVGVATLDHPAMTTGEDLLRAADGALYTAKTTGKNRVVLHNRDAQEEKP
jgi:diguanylate cyclase (GGDEF)-like protein